MLSSPRILLVYSLLFTIEILTKEASANETICPDDCALCDNSGNCLDEPKLNNSYFQTEKFENLCQNGCHICDNSGNCLIKEDIDSWENDETKIDPIQNSIYIAETVRTENLKLNELGLETLCSDLKCQLCKNNGQCLKCKKLYMLAEGICVPKIIFNKDERNQGITFSLRFSSASKI